MNWFYNSREERSKWLVERFNAEVSDSKSVLDIGCYNKDLKKYIPENIEYKGIDIDGKPDIYLNLDKIEQLPFNDNEFDMVVCADVLEHIENIHLIFDEICRVSSKYILITLPNSYAMILSFLRGKKYTENIEKLKQFGKHNKFYGLPLEIPNDRHRWFFSFEEAIDFINYRIKKTAFNISTIDTEHGYMNYGFLKKIFFALLKKINKNLVYKNIIVMIKKT